MGYGTPLRLHLEGLALGTRGTTRVMAPGRFHLRTNEFGDPANRAERQLDVLLGPGRDDGPQNPCDEFAFKVHRVTIRVLYARTQGGDALAEGLTEQDGPGTDDVLRDRAATDGEDLAAVLTWYENWPLPSPDDAAIAVTDIAPIDDEEPGDAETPTALVVTLPYRLRCRVRRDATALAP